MASLLAQAEALRRVLVVAMNEVKFLAFSRQTSAIGTRDLAGCSVVVIASMYGAILAHIPPRPNLTASDPYAGDNNVRRLMEEVKSLYEHYQNYFPNTDTYAICALYEGNVALPEQKRIIEDKLREMGLSTITSTFYTALRDPTNTAAHGTVLVDSLNRAGQKPIVYSGDRQLTPTSEQPRQQPQQPQQPQQSQQPQQPQQSHQTQQTQQTQQAWIWSSEHKRYYRWITDKDGRKQAEWAPVAKQ